MPAYRQGAPNRYGTMVMPQRTYDPAQLRTSGVVTDEPGDWFTANAPPSAAPTPQGTPETPQQELKRFEDHYHAPDREAVLAKKRAALGAPGGAGGAQGGTWDEPWFRQNIGTPGTPQELIALEGKITAAGGKVLRNAAGVAGKVQLPNGQIVDVIRSAGTGGGPQNFQWMTGEGGGGGGGQGAGGPVGGFRPGELENFGLSTTPYTPEAYTGGTYQAPEWTEQFAAPTMAQAEAEPGYKFALQQGQRGLEGAAAARGSVLSGGTQKALANYNRTAAEGNYSNVYNRALGEYGQRRQNFAGNVAQNQGNYQNRFGEYLNRNATGLQAYLANQANRTGAIRNWWEQQNQTAARGLSAARG
jgi:hypothetical protein